MLADIVTTAAPGFSRLEACAAGTIQVDVVGLKEGLDYVYDIA